MLTRRITGRYADPEWDTEDDRVIQAQGFPAYQYKFLGRRDDDTLIYLVQEHRQFNDPRVLGAIERIDKGIYRVAAYGLIPSDGISEFTLDAAVLELHRFDLAERSAAAALKEGRGVQRMLDFAA